MSRTLAEGGGDKVGMAEKDKYRFLCHVMETVDTSGASVSQHIFKMVSSVESQFH